MLLKEALERFARDKGETISKQTLWTYEAAVRSAEEHGILTTRDLTRPKIAEWLSRRRVRDLATSTINVQLAGLLSLASFLERTGHFPLQRLLQIRRLRLRQEPTPTPVYLSREELARLHVAALSIDPLAAIAVQLAVFGGLRLSELQGLDRSHVFLQEEWPYIFVAKDGHGRGRSRTTPIARGFAVWLSSRLLSSGPVFPALHPNNPSGHIGIGTLQAWLREAREAAGLYHVTWFTLRHSFASYLRQGGVELSKLSGWMGNTVRICEKHYAALAPGGDEAIEKIMPTSSAEPAGGWRVLDATGASPQSVRSTSGADRQRVWTEERRIARVRSGLWQGGAAPLGYEVAHGVLVVDPSKAAIVRSIFSALVRLRSTTAVLAELERSGARTRSGSIFRYGVLWKLLTNPVYVGRVRVGDQVLEGAQKPIVDPALFAQAQEVLADASRARRKDGGDEARKAGTA